MPPRLEDLQVTQGTGLQQRLRALAVEQPVRAAVRVATRIGVVLGVHCDRAALGAHDQPVTLCSAAKGGSLSLAMSGFGSSRQYVANFVLVGRHQDSSTDNSARSRRQRDVRPIRHATASG